MTPRTPLHVQVFVSETVIARGLFFTEGYRVRAYVEKHDGSVTDSGLHPNVHAAADYVRTIALEGDQPVADDSSMKLLRKIRSSGLQLLVSKVGGTQTYSILSLGPRGFDNTGVYFDTQSAAVAAVQEASCGL